jgi:hypothetical protein
MDALFLARWMNSRRDSGACRSCPSDQPSGLNRLILALAVIAAIVGLLGQAARMTEDPAALATQSSHSGELP